MADTDLVNLTPFTPVGTDIMYGVDDPGGTPVDGKHTYTVLATWLRSLAETLTNKVIAFGANTVSGTTAEFNTALTDGDFATLAGTETLTNKTLGSDLLLSGDGLWDIGAIGGALAEIHTDKLVVGGTEFDGTALADPGADRILFFDDSASTMDWLALSGLAITATTLAVIAATTSAAGVSELATVPEIDGGTETGLTITPFGLAASVFGTKEAGIDVFASNASVTTGNGTSGIPIPISMDGMKLVNATASVYAKGITGTTTVVIRKSRAGADVDMTSTGITLGDEWFIADATIASDGKEDVIHGDMIFADVDGIHSGTAPLGLSVVLEFRLP